MNDKNALYAVLGAIALIYIIAKMFFKSNKMKEQYDEERIVQFLNQHPNAIKVYIENSMNVIDFYVKDVNEGVPYGFKETIDGKVRVGVYLVPGQNTCTLSYEEYLFRVTKHYTFAIDIHIKEADKYVLMVKGSAKKPEYNVFDSTVFDFETFALKES